MQKGQQDPLGMGKHSWKDREAVGREEVGRDANITHRRRNKKTTEDVIPQDMYFLSL